MAYGRRDRVGLIPAYRTYHLQHHKFTQQPKTRPVAVKAFPTTRASLGRKVLRDLTGQTFFKQRMAQFSSAVKGLKAMLRGETSENVRASTKAGTPFNKQSDDGMTSPTIDVAGAMAVTRAVGRFLAVQVVLLTASLALYGWTPYLLWL